MIYIMLSKYDTGLLNEKIIQWVRENLYINNLEYKIIFCREYMYDSDISEIINDINLNNIKFFGSRKNRKKFELIIDKKVREKTGNTFVLWNPDVASKNLSYVNQVPNSVIILESQTFMNEKVSKKNPINENLAVNYGFYLMYLNEGDISKEYKLPVQTEMYLMNQKKLLNIFMSNPNNFKKTKIKIQNTFNDKENLTKNQVML